MLSKNLGQFLSYSIDLINTDDYSYSVQISNVDTKEIISNLPLDAPDNTLAAVLDENSINALGDHAGDVLEALSKALTKIGGKEFIVIPVQSALPDYLPVQDHAFKRVRQAALSNLVTTTEKLLSSYNEWAKMLDEQCEFVFGMENLASKMQHPYHQIFALLQGHASFTQGKMAEYKEEDIQGIKARVNNANVTTLALLNNQGELVGFMRSLAMGNQFGYLSDETLNQAILPLTSFTGETLEEKTKIRNQFLLAYFINRALPLIKNQNQFIIIAADGRENTYDNVGFQPFPIQSNHYIATMKLAKPGPELTIVKETIAKPFSHAQAISKLSWNASSSIKAPTQAEQSTSKPTMMG